MDIRTYRTPDGTERVSLPKSEFQDLVDARDHAIAMRDVAGGAPILTEAELDAFLAAASPLAFWRQRAGMTQTALAKKGSISFLKKRNKKLLLSAPSRRFKWQIRCCP